MNRLLSRVSACALLCHLAFACGGDPAERPRELDNQLNPEEDAGPSGYVPTTGSSNDGGAKPAPWPGPWGSIDGTVGIMAPPYFGPFGDPFRNWTDLEPVSVPAVVHFPLRGEDYTGQYDPPVKFSIAKVPATEGFVMAEPLNASDDLIPTLISAIPAAEAQTWTVPIFKRSDIDGVLSAAGVTFDPTRAIVMITFEANTQSSAPLTGMKALVSSGVRTLYATGGGWTEGDQGTSGLGMVLLAGLSAEPYPGRDVPFDFKNPRDEIIKGIAHFPLVAGAVTRVVIRADP